MEILMHNVAALCCSNLFFSAQVGLRFDWTRWQLRVPMLFPLWEIKQEKWKQNTEECCASALCSFIFYHINSLLNYVIVRLPWQQMSANLGEVVNSMQTTAVPEPEQSRLHIFNPNDNFSLNRVVNQSSTTELSHHKTPSFLNSDSFGGHRQIVSSMEASDFFFKSVSVLL